MPKKSMLNCWGCRIKKIDVHGHNPTSTISLLGWDNDKLLADQAAGDGVEHSVEEVDGLGGGEAAADLQGFVDDDGEGSGFEAEHLADGHAQQIAVDGRHTLDAPVLGV